MAIVALLALAAPAAARAVTIGASLARPPTAAFGCESLPTTDAFGNRTLLPSSFTGGILTVGRQITSCTYLGTGALGSQTEIAQAPGAGVITQARVRTGPVVGPMQFTVVRAIRGGSGVGENAGPGTACCIFRRASQVFTPAPNAVTTVTVNLAVNVLFSADPEVGEGIDYLALTVLAPGVPIPAQDLGIPGDFRLPGALAFFPGIGPEQPERADGAGVGALVPLINAEFVPCPGAALARAAQARTCAALDRTRPRLSALGVARRRLRVTLSEPGKVTLRIQRCRGKRCSTVKTLRVTAAKAGTASVRIPSSVKSGRYRVLAGATDTAGNRAKTLTRTVTV